jgi:hypothetical protein
MSGTPMIYSGQGPVYIGEFDAVNGKAASGYLKNVQAVGCAASVLKTSPTVNKKTIKESCSGQRLPLAKITTEKMLGVELTMQQFDRDMLAMALYGAAAVVAGSTVTGEVFPTVAVGDFVHLKHPGVSSVALKDSAGSPATLTAGTHYSVDSANHGRIKILNLASFVQPFKADYTYAGYSNIPAFTLASVTRGIILDAVNTADANKPVRVMIPKVDFDPTSGFDWLTDEEAPITLTGSALYVAELASDGSYGPFMRVDALPST